ncbi:hypothetical protein [Halorussus aquaticus]|uniref:Uncharacterized protein n=1 Tax=Halorussus aquaticus TaxID=2953748 RepID=A0ABD5PY49_9EURY|nr:hypothetical protein [Halorussus aquaticus]
MPSTDDAPESPADRDGGGTSLREPERRPDGGRDPEQNSKQDTLGNRREGR